MLDTNQIQTLTQGHGAVYDTNGNKIGKIGQVYLDDQTGRPEWLTVSTGLFGTSESFVPLRDARINGDDVTVPFDKDMVKDAPRVDADRHLDEAEEAKLYSYYSLDYGDRSDRDLRGDVTDRDLDRDRARTDDAMTRSEERVNVGTERHATGKVRLRKYVVTENVTQTVPVSHEEVRIEREPITDANANEALRGADISEAEREVTLHAEEPVVEKKTVPVERVRLDTETVTDEARVTEEVRKEKIDTDVEGDARRRDKGI
ncbi:PRC and DUF2382 domain-containing protein [Salinibacterium sp. ZJ454]|uniref:DUF2382 domain-containing protein n=1 Tax=Salinibacterium sp. ZJ454 TaxID=2708339 RepID=UPI00141E3C93|nr:PRC and DUF2382 domain-containing protein [Salinibacterium sp. ZJ454]